MVDVGMMWNKFWRTYDLVQYIVLRCGSLPGVCVGGGNKQLFKRRQFFKMIAL